MSFPRRRESRFKCAKHGIPAFAGMTVNNMNIISKTYKFCKKILEKILPTFCLNLLNKYKTGVKYIISGGTAAVIDLGLLYIFTDIVGIWYLFSAIISFVFSLLTSFLLHKFWTFRENSLKRMKKQFIFFTSLAIFNLGINTILMYVAVEIFGVWYMLSQFCIMGVIALMNFVINKTITFKPDNKDNKNILIATGIYPPDIGGPATYAYILQEDLPKHGFNVRIITYGDNKSKVKSSKLKVINRKYNIILRYFLYFWNVLNLLSWANIVYVQGPVSEGYPVYWACKLRGRKYFLKVVGDYAWEQMQVQSYKVKSKKFDDKNFVGLDDFQNKKFDASTERKRKIEHKVARRAEKIIVPSEYLKKIVKQWGVDESKISVVYNAVEFKAVEPKPKEHGEKWLLSVARLVPWKGMDILIEIAKEFKISDLRLQIMIIGEGPERKNLELKIKDLEVQNEVKLLGKLPHSETMAYVKAADMFVLNTGYEGLPHTIIEAQNLGTPVITTNVCGNPEVVENNQTGLLVEYNNKEEVKNAILKLLQDKDLAGRLSGNAKANLDKFDKQKMINNIIKILTT